MGILGWLISLLLGMPAVFFLGSGCVAVSHSLSDSLGTQRQAGILGNLQYTKR